MGWFVKLWLCWYKGRADPLAEISARATGRSRQPGFLYKHNKNWIGYKDDLSRASPIKRGSRVNRAGSLHTEQFSDCETEIELITSQKCLFSNARKIHDMAIFPLHRMSLDWVTKIYVFVLKTNRMVRSGSTLGFRGNYGVWTYLSFQFQMNKKEITKFKVDFKVSFFGVLI